MAVSTIADLQLAHPSWGIPSVCPLCGSALTINADHTKIKCGGQACPSNAAGNLHKWTDVIGAKGFGSEILDALIRNGCDSIPKLYEKKYYDALVADDEARVGKKTADKLFSEATAHVELSMADFIAGWNFLLVGAKAAAKVLKSECFATLPTPSVIIDTLNRWMPTAKDSVVLTNLVEGVKSNYAAMKAVLTHVNVKLDDTAAQTSANAPSFCFTGKLETLSRSEAQKMAKDAGGVIFDSVKNGLTYLVQADPNSTSGKTKKAVLLGVKVIGEQDFYKLIEYMKK